MGITTYAELQTAIANFLDRDDLTSRIPEFIVLAESRINRDLRIRVMETSTNLATVAGTATVALPTSFREAKRLYISASPNKLLKYMTPEQLIATFAGSTSGEPVYFTIEGENFRFGPTPDAIYTIPCLYYKALTALSSSVNALFTNHPDIYLYGSLAEAYNYLQEDGEVDKYLKLYKGAVQEILLEDNKDRHSGSTLYQRAG